MREEQSSGDKRSDVPIFHPKNIKENATSKTRPKKVNINNIFSVVVRSDSWMETKYQNAKNQNGIANISAYLGIFSYFGFIYIKLII